MNRRLRLYVKHTYVYVSFAKLRNHIHRIYIYSSTILFIVTYVRIYLLFWISRGGAGAGDRGRRNSVPCMSMHAWPTGARWRRKPALNVFST